ncbi:MAG: protein kinase [Polyangiales bacterium]
MSHALVLAHPLTENRGALMQRGGLIGGKYRLGPVIGSGGVATVYRATHIWTEREVAVKVLDPCLPHFERLREAFLREARATVQLDHPNVVEVLDMGEDDWATAYMVIELLQGPTLRDVLLDRGRLSETETLSILLPLIDALEKAHELGIVHRDFKPENIMLVQDASGIVIPKLLDFGVAEILRSTRSEIIRNRQDIIMGTPEYMSPEQARDQRELIGPHTDVWGVGVVWYECLTGRAPFDGDTSIQVLEAVCESTIDFGELPDLYVALFRDVLNRSTDLRIGSLSELKRRLGEMGIKLPSVPPPDPAVSSWTPAAPDKTGMQRTLAGMGPQELLAPSPSPIRVDSELLKVPFQSQRKLAFAGIGFAVVVALAAWWSVRDSGQPTAPVPEPIDPTLELPSVDMEAEVGEKPEVVVDEAIEVPPAVEPVELMDPVEPEPSQAAANELQEAPSPVPQTKESPPVEQPSERVKSIKRNVRRSKPAKRQSEPVPAASSGQPNPPDLVTEW